MLQINLARLATRVRLHFPVFRTEIPEIFVDFSATANQVANANWVCHVWQERLLGLDG